MEDVCLLLCLGVYLRIHVPLSIGHGHDRVRGANPMMVVARSVDRVSGASECSERNDA